MPDITCLIVPSLPAASSPCKTINRERVSVAYSRSWATVSSAVKSSRSWSAVLVPKSPRA